MSFPPNVTGPAYARLTALVFLLSSAILAYEIALMRILLVASWYHFASVLISLALLGFGASGTALTLLRGRLLPRTMPALLMLALAAATAMPVCALLAGRLPLEARFVPALMWRQAGTWMLAGTLLTIPFFLGASAIGLALMAAGRRLPGVYAANLLGSGAGAVLAPSVMLIVAPAGLPFITAIPAVLGAMIAAPGRRWLRLLIGMAGTVALILASTAPASRASDPFKYGAFMENLVEQGDVERAGTLLGPRSMLEGFRGSSLHDLPFLGVGGAPPELSVIVTDGHWAGSVCAIRTIEEAAALDFLLGAAAHELAPPSPRVALLGEIGGVNAWVAARRDAVMIDMVQPDPNVPRMLAGPLADDGGAALLTLPGLRAIIDEPRHFVTHTKDTYDLIQIVTLEGSAAGSGGVAGLAEDHLVTVEGLTACLRRLDPKGLLVTCRGIQTPPRDNLKIIATLAEALRRLGIDQPADHMLVLRDYLAVSTIVRPTPWTPDDVEQVRQLCAGRQLTPVWFPGVRPEELNRPDALPAPPDGTGDWFHHGAVRLLDAETGPDFIERWRFDIRPPTDDRPFFADFCRLRSIAALREAYGELWLTRSELALPFVIGAIIVIGLIGVLLTLLPLRALPRGERRGRTATAVYFAAIGVAYLLLEIACLSRFTHLVGDPVTSAAVTIGGFLVFSGAGSLTVQRLGPERIGSWRPFGTLLVIGVVTLIALPSIAAWGGGLSVPARCATALLTLAPLAWAMGFPMPMALARLQRGAPALLPWAWGVNGFASVLAAPLATVIGMTWGFSWAAMAALVCYLIAGVMFGFVPQEAVSCQLSAVSQSAPPADS